MAIYIDRNKPSSGLANLLAAKGRHGDTELVHMTKPEIQRLRNTGLMTLNPKTGLPEMFLGDVFKGLKSYAKNFLKPKNLIPTVLGMAAAPIFGSALAGTGLGQFLGRAGSDALLRAGGVTLGSLPFRSPSESFQAGATTGLIDYGMSKIGDMFRPGPAAYGLDGAGKKLSRAQLEDMRGRVGESTRAYEEADAFSGDEDLFSDDYIQEQISVPEKLQPFMTGKVDDQGLAKFRNQFSRLSGADQQRLTGWTPASDPAKARTFIRSQVKDVVNPEEVGAFQFGGLGADKAAQQAAYNKYLRRNRLLSTPKMRAQALDPWGPFKDKVSSADGLSSIDVVETMKTMPLGHMAQTVGSAQEGLGITDAMAQQGYTEEELADIENQLARRGTYIPTSNKIYRTPFERRPVIPRRAADKGGLVSLAHGGDMRRDFEGLVQGRGHGMQDNVIMDIKQKGGLLAVSPKEYVVPADVMANLGNGNPDAGAEHMDKFISDFRKKKYGRDKQPPEMDGGTALQSLMA